MADRLKKLLGEIRPNALWDFVKWIILLGMAAMSFALSRLPPLIVEMPEGILTNVIIFLIGLALVIIGWIVGRRKNKKRLRAIYKELDATYNKEITELKQQNTSLETTIQERDRALEANRVTIERLRRQAESLGIANSSREAEIQRYKWLHKMADEQARDISKRVQVLDYFSCYERSAEHRPHIILGFDILNTSVFEVVIEANIKGYIWLDGAVELSENRRITSKSDVILPLTYGHVIIKQPLDRLEFDLIAEREDSRDGAFFYFNKLEITIKITTPYGEIKEVRLELPQTLSSKARKNRAAIELKEFQQRANNIENLTFAYGSCCFAYKRLEREEILSDKEYQTLKNDIGQSLSMCYGSEKGDEFFNQQPPFPSTLQEQKKWVDLQCKNLRELIEKERA